MKQINILLLSLLATALLSCDPETADDVNIGLLPVDPDFRIELTADNRNRVIIEDLSMNSFSRVWSLPGGTPNTSTMKIDTILYTAAGDYEITLNVASVGGGGNASTTKQINIVEDAALTCNTELELLLGGCEETSTKCWTFSQVAGAVSVGPFPGSSEWFSSSEGSLQAEQYDDGFCFSFAGNGFLYANNGETIDPWDGYQAVPYDPPTDQVYTLIPGGGEEGETRIVLPEGAFMGVWDSGPFYDIVTLTESDLVVRGPTADGGGWFELYFVAQ